MGQEFAAGIVTGIAFCTLCLFAALLWIQR